MARLANVLLLMLPTFLPAMLKSQEINDSIALDEVVIKADKVVSTADGQRIYPTQRQKEASTGAYSLLEKMALPYIKVDPVMHTIKAPEMLGEVQVRINGVIASKEELLSMDMSRLQHVQFITNPGVRYGRDIGFVINFVLRKADRGYTVGTDVMRTLTADNGKCNVYAKYNRGRGEFTFSYIYGWSDFSGQRFEENASYLMPDNSYRVVRRRDLESINRDKSHEMRLSYNVSDSGRYVMQAAVSGIVSRSPGNYRRRLVETEDDSYETEIFSSDKSLSPRLDFYFNYDLPHGQSLTETASGTYAGCDYSYRYAGLAPYNYSTDGRAYSFSSETIYENMLKPFALSAGVSFSHQYTANTYGGDIYAVNGMHDSEFYAFAQIRGRWRRLGYILGAGLNGLFFSQGDQRYEYWSFRPKLTLDCNVTDKVKIKYDLGTVMRPPKQDEISDVAVISNEFEANRGNSGLVPYRRIENRLEISYRTRRLFTSVNAMYRINSNCIMQQIERETDADGMTRFVFSSSNQDRINFLYFKNSTNYDVIPDKISLSLDAGVYRCFNYGDTYKHHYTAFNGSVAMTAYLGRLTLSANADSGWRVLENETRIKQYPAYFLTASYRFGNAVVSCYWQHCFDNDVSLYRGCLMNRFVGKTSFLSSSDYGNMLTLNLSWHFTRGKKYDSHGVKRMGAGINTGIMKQDMK